MYHHDYSELEVLGDISNHLCILCDDFIVVPEALFCFFGFLSTFFGLSYFGPSCTSAHQLWSDVSPWLLGVRGCR
jgi:hypothetical protein